jgi:hypothetical protein
VPRKTRYRWLEAGRQHPTEPFVGRGRLRAEDQRMRERERTVRDRQEETAILKKPATVKPPYGHTIAEGYGAFRV